MNNTSHLVMPERHMESLYTSKNPLVRWVHQARLKTAVSLIPSKSVKILDVGCGEGHLLECIGRGDASKKLYGVDVLPHAAKQAKNRMPQATIVTADAANMPFPDGFFDAAICIDVLEHAPHWRAIVDEMFRIVRKGGVVILGWPNDFNWNLSRRLLGKGPVPDHINILTPRIVQGWIGLKPRKTRRMPSSLPWAFCLYAQESYVV